MDSIIFVQNPIPNIIDLVVEDNVDEKLKGIMGTSRNSDQGVVKRGNHNQYLLVKGLLDSITSKNTTYEAADL
ncbi:hypothetical protein ACOSQ4_027503 [Xanthoceras sorbifolium]